MKAKIILTISFIFSFWSVFGQTDKYLKEVRSRYYSLKEEIALTDSAPSNFVRPLGTMNIFKNYLLPNVVPYGQSITYYFKTEPYDENDINSTKVKKKLVFIKGWVNVYCDYSLEREFLFDTLGNLMFYFEKYERDDGSAAHQYRFYFHNGKIFMVKIKKFEDGELVLDKTYTKDFKKFLTEINKIEKETAHLKRIFYMAFKN